MRVTALNLSAAALVCLEAAGTVFEQHVRSRQTRACDAPSPSPSRGGHHVPRDRSTSWRLRTASGV
jgi:hypothetical protein